MRVYITIDVECSLPSPVPHHASDFRKGNGQIHVGTEKRVYGEIADKRYGIEFIMDMLGQHGFNGTFFCDTCMTYLVGEPEVGEVMRKIASRGYDVQLHIHPIYHLWASPHTESLLAREGWSDFIGALPVWLQAHLIEEGRDMIKKYTGRAPTAFRAGNYGASETTIKLLADRGFLVDSSYNLWAQENAKYGEILKTPEPINIPFEINGIREIPVTSFLTHERSPNAYRFFTPEGASFSEMRLALTRLKAAGVKDVVVVLHSFSFIKTSDPQYQRIRFNTIVYQRFKRLLQFLAERREDYEVLSIGDYLLRGHKQEYMTPVPEHFVHVPLWAAVRRIAGQFIQRYIYTILFAILNHVHVGEPVLLT